MFETFRNAWKIEDLRKRLLFTLLILVLFLAGNSAMTMTVFGWSDVLWRLTALAGQAGLENVCALFAGILLGRLTLLIGRRGGADTTK